MTLPPVITGEAFDIKRREQHQPAAGERARPTDLWDGAGVLSFQYQ
jgi:hypothetical protein